MAINESSFTAASSFPQKLLHNQVIDNGKIKPIHIQVIPTNACNLSCEFCSCDDRDKKKSFSLDQMESILDAFSNLGTKAMTVTGGGEPLMHPKINDFLRYADRKGIQAGLVTNGILLKNLAPHENLTWCRISSSDDRYPAYDAISSALRYNPRTDWAFSHVITENPDYELIYDLINYANKNNFSHVRLVSDLFNLDKVPDMSIIKKKLDDMNLDDSLVIYQGRKDSLRGDKDCYISLLKPVISPEGVFPCCGSQYSIHGSKKDMIEEMKMCDITQIKETWNNQEKFNGGKCDVCYYSQYNSSLEKLLHKPEHNEFV